MSIGWGRGPWGHTGWGVPSSSELLQLVEAEAIRENVTRLTFNRPIYFSELLDPMDASTKERYSVVPVSGSVDDHGLPTRPVFPALVAIVNGSMQQQVDVAVDRPFSSWPSRYLVSVNHIRSLDGTPLDLTSTSKAFDGVQYDILGGNANDVVQGGDFSNPQTAGGLGIGLPLAQAALLGGFPVSDAGDYAVDQGLASYEKRIIRRLLTSRLGFAYLSPSFGLDAQTKIKKLFRKTDGTRLAAEARAQILADPETANCSVVFVPRADAVNLATLQIIATHTSGASVNSMLPVQTG